MTIQNEWTQKLYTVLKEEKELYLKLHKQAKLQNGLLKTEFEISSLQTIIFDRQITMQKIAELESSIITEREYWSKHKDNINDTLGIRNLSGDIANILKEIMQFDDESNKILETKKTNIKIKAEEVTSSRTMHTAYSKSYNIPKKIGRQFKTEI